MKNSIQYAVAMLCIGSFSFAEQVVFQDDFSAGSTLTQKNKDSFEGSWSVAGPEMKEYNVDGSGQFVIQDDLPDEKGAGVNQGYFDVVSCSLRESCLKNDGDWIQVSVDLNLFAGSYPGAAIANLNDGLRIGLTGKNSGGTGYGMYLSSNDKGGAIWVKLSEPNVAGKKLQVISGFKFREVAAPTPFVLRITKASDGIELSGTLGNTTFTPCKIRTAVQQLCFDDLSFCLARVDHGLVLDNVVVTASDESVVQAP